MAPVLYLQDKSSNFADGIEDDNWEEQAANRLTHAMQGLDQRSHYYPCALVGRKTTSPRCRNWLTVTVFPLKRVRQLERTR